MPHPFQTRFILFLALSGVLTVSAQAGAPGETETPELRQRIVGRLITEQPVGGILAIDLPSANSALLRPTGGTAVVQLGGMDEEGRTVFVDEVKGGWNPWLRTTGYAVHLLTGQNEQKLFSGPGDPLWDHALAPPALAPRGGKVAFVAQPAENEGQRFRQLVKGPLKLWDPAAAAVRDLGVIAANGRPAWFPDGQKLAYTSLASGEAVVHIFDTGSGKDEALGPGHLSLVSSDGGSVLVTRGAEAKLIVIDVASREERTVARTHGLSSPVALIDGRYLIYKGRPTPGAPTGLTEHNSNFVGAKPMVAVKVMDLQSGQFATLVPLIDPRNTVLALAHAAQ